MPAERAPMRKVREVLRLKYALGLSERQIAASVGVSRSTVGEYLRRAGAAGITWPVPEGIYDAELERRLFTLSTFEPKPTRWLPDWHHVHKELKRHGVTLLLLWEEYRAQHIDGYGYSRFCDLYRDWLKTVSPTMRQTHAAGEKLFVDWAGDTVPAFDALTGQERRAHIFVAVLGASNYIYVEASIGPATIALIEAIMKAKPHPEQGFRACLGILRLERSYGSARLEAACRRGNEIGATTYRSIASILKGGLDKAYAQEPTPEAPPIRHGNIRGTGYYH